MGRTEQFNIARRYSLTSYSMMFSFARGHYLSLARSASAQVAADKVEHMPKSYRSKFTHNLREVWNAF